MPHFEHPVSYDADELLKDMDRLFACVDAIQIFRILGREPFLYKDLDKIVRKALESKKVKTVDIVTNGTILPGKKLLKALKNLKLTIQISDYGEYSGKKEELKAVCNAVGVKCIIRGSKEKIWFDAGGLENRGGEQ